MSHTVIQIADDGQVISAASLATEEMVAAKLKAMEAAGQRGIPLYWQQIAYGDIQLLVWDGEQQRLTRRAETLVELRAPLLQAVKQMHGQAAQANIALPSGAMVQGDGRSQGVVAGFAHRIRAGQVNPHGGKWRCADNTMIAFSDDDVLALDAAFVARNAAMQSLAWHLADAIRAETDAAKLKAFDVASAWNETLATNSGEA